MTSDFEKKLAKYAELIVKVGLNLQPGQRLFIWTGPLEVAPLVREVTAAAYANGAPLVSVLWMDEQIGKIRLENAPADSFEEYPSWTTEGLHTSMQRGDAYLQLFGLDPQRLKGQDPDHLAIAGKTASKHYKPIGALQSRNAVQWAYVAAVTSGWAQRVFPSLSPQDAEERLWEAVFAACRLDQPDPIALWTQQEKDLSQRKISSPPSNTRPCISSPLVPIFAWVCPQAISGKGVAISLPKAFPLWPTSPPKKCIQCPTKTKWMASLPLANHSVTRAT